MKKIIPILILLLCSVSICTAQEKQPNEKKKFSHIEYQKRQKEFIIKYVGLTTQEAEAFFPLFFELQKKKWNINKEARNKAGFKRGEKPSEEKCTHMVNELANAKIEIAQLEKEYIALYMKVISAEKILRVQHAEERFQREILKNMRNSNCEKRNDKK